MMICSALLVSAILVVNIADPLMLSVASVFRSSFLNGLRAKSGGPCVDEFMMMFHTRVNCDLEILSHWLLCLLLFVHP